jgi:very-short-patch-repair endonuclease
MSGYERWKQQQIVKRKMHVLASELRQRSTHSEELLWEALRNRQLGGRKFKRQVPIGAFVLDFYCAEEKLAIEIDGKIHQWQENEDALRQQTLESLGIRFLRLTSEQVENDFDGALEIIRQAYRD